MRVLNTSKEIPSQLFLHVCPMLHLLRVVECCSMVSCSLRIACFGNVEGCEGVDGHEGSKVHTVASAAEHILMEHEVGTEKDQSCFKVHHRWVALT